jgi:glycosidase
MIFSSASVYFYSSKSFMSALFKPVEWSYQTNIYEVNVRQYTPEGTFRAFAKHLPRLKGMGVETLWFMPITPISLAARLGSLGSYYSCSDYTSTNPEFGSLDDFRNLVKKAQTSGFKVIIDWVANHTGHDHHWTKDYPEYYLKNEKGEFYDSHGWQDVIDLNYYNSGLRAAMIDAMKFWVKECNIDGFRCDMAHLVPLDFWREARTQLDEIKPLFWLAETEMPIYHEVFDASYTWTWMHKTNDFIKGKITFGDLKNVLIDETVRFPLRAMRLWFTTNHDENSWNGTEYEKYGDAAKPLAVFSATYRGIPLIYSGQELPNQKRLKFFDKDNIDWKEECALEPFYKLLLTLRKKNAALAAREETECFMLSTNVEQQVLAFMRKRDANYVLVLLNISANEIAGSFTDQNVNGKFKDVLGGKQVDFSKDRSFQLKAWDYGIFVK